jgi:hypothetical protein
VKNKKEAKEMGSAKEISMSQLVVGLNSQQQVSIVAPTSSDPIGCCWLLLAFRAKLLIRKTETDVFGGGTNDRRTG